MSVADDLEERCGVLVRAARWCERLTGRLEAEDFAGMVELDTLEGPLQRLVERAEAAGDYLGRELAELAQDTLDLLCEWIYEDDADKWEGIEDLLDDVAG